jgi:competence protein ComEA
MQQRPSQFRTIPSSPLSAPSPVFQQGTQPLPIPPPDLTPIPEPFIEAAPLPLLRVRPFSKKGLTRIVAIGLALLLTGAIFVIWFVAPAASSSSPQSNVTQQSFGSSSQNSGAGTPTGGALHVYVIGSVRHPGVYTLPAGARVYQLLQAAGGALPQADLVSLNLAAPLTDGQEVYVLTVGETPPTYLGGVPGPGTTNGTVTTTTTTTQNGQLVNINTATSDEMRTILHVSSTTAQKIIAGRPYTSVAQLLQVVSREIYDKIEASVTV